MLIHGVYNSNAHFKIDPITRAVKAEGTHRFDLVQYDHNSTCFTFELPRVIGGHNMLECTSVQVHYTNIDALSKKQNNGVYEVTDLQVSPEDPEVVICSWVVSCNATQYEGELHFLLRFICTDEESDIKYAWNTAVNTNIKVVEGIYNGDNGTEGQWRAEALVLSNAIDELEKRVEEFEESGGSNSAISNHNVNENAHEVLFTPLKSRIAALERVANSKNLYNKDTKTDGFGLSLKGTLYEQENYSVSDYIAVESGETYTVSFHDYAVDAVLSIMCFYDNAQTFVSYLGSGEGNTFTVPQGVSYVRFSTSTERMNGKLQFEQSETATSYEPFGTTASISDHNESADAHKELFDTKLDKITEEWIVYGTGTGGVQTKYRLGTNATANTVVRRTDTGTLRTATPVDNDDAVNLLYLNNSFTPIEERLDALEESGGTSTAWNSYRVRINDLEEDEERTITLSVGEKRNLLCFIKINIDNGYSAFTDPFILAFYDDDCTRTIPLMGGQGTGDGFDGQKVTAWLGYGDVGDEDVAEFTIPANYREDGEVYNDAGFDVTIYYQTF